MLKLDRSNPYVDHEYHDPLLVLLLVIQCDLSSQEKAITHAPLNRDHKWWHEWLAGIQVIVFDIDASLLMLIHASFNTGVATIS